MSTRAPTGDLGHVYSSSARQVALLIHTHWDPLSEMLSKLISGNLLFCSSFRMARGYKVQQG